MRFLLLAIFAHALNIYLVMAMPTKSRYESDSADYSGAGGEAQGGSVHEMAQPAHGCPDGHCPELQSMAGAPLLNVASNDAGDGGIGTSGKSGRLHPCKRGTDNAYSGVGGKAGGGDVDAAPGLINLWSNNAGSGGEGTSGEASSDAESC